MGPGSRTRACAFYRDGLEAYRVLEARGKLSEREEREGALVKERSAACGAAP